MPIKFNFSIITFTFILFWHGPQHLLKQKLYGAGNIQTHSHCANIKQKLVFLFPVCSTNLFALLHLLNSSVIFMHILSYLDYTINKVICEKHPFLCDSLYAYFLTITSDYYLISHNRFQKNTYAKVDSSRSYQCEN